MIYSRIPNKKDLAEGICEDLAMFCQALFLNALTNSCLDTENYETEIYNAPDQNWLLQCMHLHNSPHSLVSSADTCSTLFRLRNGDSKASKKEYFFVSPLLLIMAVAVYTRLNIQSSDWGFSEFNCW